MAKRYKGIKASTINRRIKALEKEFGSDSNVVKAAKDWIEFRVDEPYKTADGYIDESVEEVKGKRWAHVNDAIPTVNAVLRREFKEAPEKAKDFIGPSILPEKYKDVKNNPQAVAYLKNRANVTADLLIRNDDIIDTLYIAKDDDKYPKQSTAKEYYDELQEYGWLGTVLNWLQKVNVIVEDYLTWCDEQNKEAKASF